MTTVSLGRSMPNRRRAHAALATAAAAMVGVATVVVGAQLIGVTPPTSAGTYASTTASTRPPADTSPYCAGGLTSACGPARIHSSHTALTRSSPYRPATWNP
jgi:hypothetical protein